MKKSKLLSLATAGAVVVTTFGTFAAWDQLEVTGGAVDVTMDKAVTMELTDASFGAADTRATLSAETGTEQTATATVVVKDVPAGAKEKYELATEAEITNSDGTAISNDEVTVSAIPTDKALSGEASDSHAVTVTVTPKDESASGKTYKVTLTAKVVEKAAK